MKIFNTEAKKKEPIEESKVKIYACGPTVYDRAHVGNLRMFISVDILVRSLRYLGFKVEYVMNITDIEDKIINKAKKLKIDYKEITKKYEELFWKDLGDLNIKNPDKSPHATDDEVIEKMIEIIETLVDRGFAYKAGDGSIYFSIDKYKSYGKLSNLNKEGIKVGSRVSSDEYQKENPRDFSLWKKEEEKYPNWKGPLGIVGRPGWHIECSAMSMLYLGETIDIHAGGSDLIFPHHENEVAQSEAYTGKKFVKKWFHGGMLSINGGKMSKSLGNLYTVDDLKSVFDAEPLALRMLCLQSHYRDGLNFTDKSIKDAQNTLFNLKNFVNKVSQFSSKESQEVKALIKKSKKEFDSAIKDDLNTPKALASLFGFISSINKINPEIKDRESILDYISGIDSVLGLDLVPEKIEENIKDLFDKYLKARKNKNWDDSDKLRKNILELGWAIEDQKNSSVLRKNKIKS